MDLQILKGLLPIVAFMIAFWHLLYDFHIQGPFVAEWKGKSYFILFVHALTWTMGISIFLWLGGIFAWWKFFMLLISHMAIDRWKCSYRSELKNFWTLYVDQALHVITMIWAIWK